MYLPLVYFISAFVMFCLVGWLAFVLAYKVYLKISPNEDTAFMIREIINKNRDSIISGVTGVDPNAPPVNPPPPDWAIDPIADYRNKPKEIVDNEVGY